MNPVLRRGEPVAFLCTPLTSADDFACGRNFDARQRTDLTVESLVRQRKLKSNARFLDGYKGADGIKTGYTGPAGFNLTASAERGNVRIIATVFGGTSTAQRNDKMADLLDLGFARAPAGARTAKPAAPVYADPETPRLASAVEPTPDEGEVDTVNGSGKTLRVSGGVSSSPRPKPRPGAEPAQDPAMLMAMNDTINAALAEASGALPAPAPAQTVVAGADPASPQPPAPAIKAPQPAALPFQLVSADQIPAGALAATAKIAEGPKAVLLKPRARPSMVLLAAASPGEAVPEDKPEVVSRMSSSS